MERMLGRRASAPPLTLAPLELRRSMARIGPIWGQDIQRHAQIVFEAYAPLVRAASRHGVGVTRDIAYGEHPRQVLDIYRAVPYPVDSNGGARPVVMFVHGGAFVRGDRDLSPEFYANVPTWFARNGCIGINVEYRLAPGATYPEGGRDVGRAVEWVRKHIRSYGGDPTRIVLVGHSAGGAHVAGFAFDPAVRENGGPPAILGQVLVSARVLVDARPDNPNAAGVQAYFGDDPSLYEARSPMTYAAGSRVPTMIVAAEFENPLLDQYALDLFHRMSRSAPAPLRFVQLDRHNHTSIVAHFDTEEETLGREILDFLASLATPAGAGAVGSVVS